MCLWGHLDYSSGHRNQRLYDQIDDTSIPKSFKACETTSPVHITPIPNSAPAVHSLFMVLMGWSSQVGLCAGRKFQRVLSPLLVQIVEKKRDEVTAYSLEELGKR